MYAVVKTENGKKLFVMASKVSKRSVKGCVRQVFVSATWTRNAGNANLYSLEDAQDMIKELGLNAVAMQRGSF